MSRFCQNERINGLPPVVFLATFIFVSCFVANAPIARAVPTVTSIDITVPHKGDVAHPELMEISTLKITISVASTAAVGFTITPPGAGAVDVDPSAPGGSLIIGLPLGNGDFMNLIPPTAVDPAHPSDPTKRKYVIVINLISNIDFGGTCGSTMSAPEAWRIAVRSGPAIDGVCLQSLDPNTGGLCQPASNLRAVPPNEARATVSPTGSVGSLQGCRPGVDCVLVLDRSGSMDNPVAGGPESTMPKLVALKNAVRKFMETWIALRANEAADAPGLLGVASPTDRVGVILFDSSSPAKWLKDVDADSLTTPRAAITNPPLDVFTDNLANDIKNSFRTIGPGQIMTAGATSIGSGLKLADGSLRPLMDNGNRQVFVVMTDGIENTRPLSGVNPPDSTNVETVDGSVHTSLTSQPPAQIYALTIGSPGAINEEINVAITRASNGILLNSEYDATVLANFFTEVLQNFIRYSTVETYRMASATTELGAPYTTTMPVTSGTTSLIFSLSWNGHRGPLRLTVTPPGGAAPIVRIAGSGDDAGTILLNIRLPLQGNLNSGGDWGIRVEPEVIVSSLGSPPQVSTVPFNLIVLGDDVSLNADLTNVAADYAPGDQIRLTAKVTVLGEPVTGLNAQPGARIVAELVAPDAGGIGDLLSGAVGDTTQPASSDPLSPVDAILQNVLRNNPNAIKRATPTITLFDDGSETNGDAVAGDGVYSAQFPAPLIGHYNFLFGVVGRAKNVGRFSRQQLRTVYVRAVPDGNTTTTSSSVQAGTPNVLVIDMTPLTKFGNHLGPGWGNYFWVTGSGMTPMKFSDNLNGTYTARIPFTGNPPSDVKVHFERVSERIPDDATANNLPMPLGNGTVIVPHVNVPSGGFKRWGLSLHAGVSVPHPNFDDLYKPGANLAVDLEYRFNQTWSLEGIYGFHHFNGKTFGLVTVGDLNLHQFSLNGKVYGSSAPVRPFVNFGGGAYVFTPGASVHGGLNVGGGLQFDVTPNFAVEGVYNFHNVFTSGSNTTFSGVQGGVRFRF